MTVQRENSLLNKKIVRADGNANLINNFQTCL